jgi:hypothetical protein
MNQVYEEQDYRTYLCCGRAGYDPSVWPVLVECARVCNGGLVPAVTVWQWEVASGSTVAYISSPRCSWHFPYDRFLACAGYNLSPPAIRNTPDKSGPIPFIHPMPYIYSTPKTNKHMIKICKSVVRELSWTSGRTSICNSWTTCNISLPNSHHRNLTPVHTWAHSTKTVHTDVS